MKWWKWVLLGFGALLLWVFVYLPWSATVGKPVIRADMVRWPFMAEKGHAGCEQAVMFEAVWFQPDGDPTKYPMNIPALLAKPIGRDDFKYPGKTSDILAGSLSADAATEFYKLACDGRPPGMFGEVVAAAVNSNDRG